MRKNKNKPETVDTSSVSETEELNVPRKKKKKTGLVVFLDRTRSCCCWCSGLLFYGTTETDLHNQKLSSRMFRR